MLRTVIARSAHELDSLAPVWRRLQSSATIFQSFEWNRLAARFFASRQTPCVVLVENDSACALIPAALCATGLTLLGEELFDYRDVLGDPDLLPTAWGAVAGLDRPLRFHGLCESAAARWDWASLSPFAAAPRVLRCEIDAEAFAAEHSRAAHRVRRLLRDGAHLRQFSGASSGLVRWIYQRKAEQSADTPNLFTDPLRVDFMVEAAAINPAACEIFTLENRGGIIAALITFRDDLVRRFYTIYYDHAWARISPGIALLYEVTRLSLADGLDCDYMTGEQPHKTRFATSSTQLLRVSASPAAMLQPAAELLPHAA